MSAPWATFVEISVHVFQLFFLVFYCILRIWRSQRIFWFEAFSGVQGFIFSFRSFFLKFPMYIWFASPSPLMTIWIDVYSQTWMNLDARWFGMFVVLILWLWLGFLSYYMHSNVLPTFPPPKTSLWYSILSCLPITHCRCLTAVIKLYILAGLVYPCKCTGEILPLLKEVKLRRSDSNANRYVDLGPYRMHASLKFNPEVKRIPR